MAKISIGKLTSTEEGDYTIEVKEEKGTLIQNCGYIKNGKHLLSLSEALFLSQSGLLSLEPSCFLEKYCCMFHGVNETNQSMKLFELGIKNKVIAGNSIVFIAGSQSGRLSKALSTSMLSRALPCECFFKWVDSHFLDLENSQGAIFTYIQMPQAFAFFKINEFELPIL